jgi:zinc protease
MIHSAFPLRPAAFAAALGFLTLLVPTARAVEIQEVTSPGGITAWLVEDHTNPLVSMEFAFRGGAKQDPEGKEGLATMVSGLLDEGAGDLDSSTFQLRLDESSARLSFSADRDMFRGSLDTLSSRQDEAFDLLRLALSAPRFDEEPVERVRNQLLAAARRASTDPDSIASDAWFKTVFGDHPYARRTTGTEESLPRIAVEDLRDYHRSVLARDNLIVGVVGDITADELARRLDEVFGALPEASAREDVPQAEVKAQGGTEIIPLAVPQSSIVFGGPGLKRDDPDFIPAYVVNHIFGGGGFSSRLYEEVREKRGLVYSVGSYLYPLREAGLLLGNAGTQNARVGEALDVLRAEMARMGAEGPSAEDLEKAKRFLVGNYALRFDSSGKIANQLVAIQADDLGIDYIDKRNDLVQAVTLEDAKRVAARLFDPQAMTVTVVGQPEGEIAPNPGG